MRRWLQPEPGLEAAPEAVYGGRILIRAKNCIVRHTKKEDIPKLIELQRRVYPSIPPWTRAKLANQLEIFPAGQLTAECNGEVVGCASSLVVLWDDWADAHSWKEITAAGTFENHDPEGRTLYGAEVFVAPEMRGSGLGHLLYEGRRTLCREMNLKRIIACGRLPGYHRHASEMDAEMYAKRVVWGDFEDLVLSFQLREGFRYCGVVDDYLPEDKESCGCASIIVWLNPDYRPRKPTHVEQEEVL